MPPGDRADPSGNRAYTERPCGRRNRSQPPCRARPGPRAVPPPVAGHGPARVGTAVEVEGHPVRYGVVGSGPASLFLHGWGLRPNAYRRHHRGHEPGRVPGVRARPSPGSGGPASCRPSSAPSPVTPPGWAGSSTRWVRTGWRWWPATRSGAAWPPHSPTRRPWRVSALLLANAIGSPTWALFPNEVRTMVQRPVLGLGPPLHAPTCCTRPACSGCSRPCSRTSSPTWSTTRSGCSGPVSSSAGPTWCVRCGPSPGGGSPCTSAWSDRDRLVPRSAFDDLRRAAGVDGVVVEGSHAWLIAEPAAFGELAISALVDSGTTHAATSVGRLSAPLRVNVRPRRPPGSLSRWPSPSATPPR